MRKGRKYDVKKKNIYCEKKNTEEDYRGKEGRGREGKKGGRRGISGCIEEK